MLRYAAVSDIGLVRRNNEDSLYAGCPWGGLEEDLFIVADGMGGHKGGEYASRFVALKIPELLKMAGKKNGAVPALQYAVERCNKALYQISQDQEDLNGMGSTLVLAYLDKDEWIIVNVGDSRVYQYRDHELIQITEDHSQVEELVRAGRLERTDALYLANRHVITRAMGVEPYVEEDLFTAPAMPGSRLLLCSDGLHGMIEDSEIAAVLEEEGDLNAAARRLITLAKEQGGRDNVTLILVEMQEENK